MTTFIKFGGSVITDKRIAESADHDAIARMAQAVATARTINPQLQLVLSHGSGSYGHVAAARYGIHKGLAADADWFGFAATSAAALRLNRLVVDALLAVDIGGSNIRAGIVALNRKQAGDFSKWAVASSAPSTPRVLRGNSHLMLQAPKILTFF